MTNARTLKSRNQREGWFVGRVQRKVLRMPNARTYLEDDMPRGEWGLLSKDQVRMYLTECSIRWDLAVKHANRINYD